MSSQSVKHISECFVQPQHASDESKQPLYLAPTDLAMLSAHYIQKGLLFAKPPEAMNDHKKADFINALLKNSSTLSPWPLFISTHLQVALQQRKKKTHLSI
ncbi:unnamed protein product [Prunus armeniaca]|uniref:Uncharacterized protein n=1 Tax=Prunus armeniaca TaxID=36596 RepID=A0A6J5TRL6_PRUAR|nr:unnamed protein product [Prunus armeniaca]